MKKLIAVILIIATVFTAVMALDRAALDEKMDSFATQLADFIPRSISNMNLWADAHIGNIIPLNGLPHLGAGATAGGVLIPTDLITTFKDAFPKGTKEWELFPLPALSFDARVGGFVLPFDVGIHLMALESYEKEFWDVKAEMTNLLTYGGDVRFAIIQEGVVAPALSIGVGYTKAKGEFIITTTDTLPDSALSAATAILGTNDEEDAYTELNVAYDTSIYTATVQLSKKILLLTPFVGARAIVQNGVYNYSYSYGEIDGVTNNGSTTKTIEKSFSFNNLANSDIKYSVFAGLGVDFLIIQTTVGANYDFKDKSWAGSISIHVKI
ncbi:MAG: hypothetical protein K5751_03095 [Treponemataceae bacterium]|nr:hypothetical protein [Treponemataceae bacterium]